MKYFIAFYLFVGVIYAIVVISQEYKKSSMQNMKVRERWLMFIVSVLLGPIEILLEILNQHKLRNARKSNKRI